MPLEQAWADWIADERDVPASEPRRRSGHIPPTPYRDITPRALGSVSRAFYDAAKRTIYAGFNYPGRSAHVGAISLDDGAIEKIARHQGAAVIYTVTSLAFDPAASTLFYTADNGALSRSHGARSVTTNRTRMLLKDARIGDLASIEADRSRSGASGTLNGICTLVRIRAAVHGVGARALAGRTARSSYDLDVSPDGTRLSASFGEINGKQDVRVFETDAAAAPDDPTPVAQFDFGTAVPTDFVFSPDGRYLYGSSYYTGVSNIFRYDLATRQARGGDATPRPASSGRFRSAATR